MAETAVTEVASVRVLFASRFQAHLAVTGDPADVVARERDLIQLFTLSWVKVLFLLGENKQAPMLIEYFQKAMGDTVTPQGLKRPTITAPDQKLLEAPPEKSEKEALLRLVQEEEARLADLVLPLGDEGFFYPAISIFFLQYLIRNLSEASLFFLMLVMGGVMEYYEKIGKTNDLKALADGPTYGFSTAMRYVADEQRRSQGPPASAS